MFDQWPRALYHCDQPHGDISFLPTLRVSELAARELKVVLTGDGGDELFAGYEKYRDFFAQPEAGAEDDAFQRAYFDSISLFTPKAVQGLYTPAQAAAVKGLDPFELAAGHFAEVPHFDRINQALYLDMTLLLPGNNLVKPDRMGMAVSLEARTPFLDYRMMELAFRLPGALKLQGGETKFAYKRAVAPLIGEHLTYRKKQMFTVPVGEPFCRKFLLEARTTERGIFQPAQVEKMLAEHVAGSRNYTREIRALIALEIWQRLFIDENGRKPAPEYLASYLSP
jgi:asparagine synthase (glutamine-hydrolysing)